MNADILRATPKEIGKDFVDLVECCKREFIDYNGVNKDRVENRFYEGGKKRAKRAKMGLESIDHDFRSNFVDNIAKGDWSKVLDRVGSGDFLYESNEGVIDFLEHVSSIEESRVVFVRLSPTTFQLV
ncbi:hypothetical protein LIER_12282 [Lithospermum erythrorhizon]|uniref:Uncharacterized protein n=1 Tax=Lithospermum erythrorhizon TaxID=34254 RepID=A0AAV3PU70_LITER